MENLGLKFKDYFIKVFCYDLTHRGSCRLVEYLEWVERNEDKFKKLIDELEGMDLKNERK